MKTKRIPHSLALATALALGSAACAQAGLIHFGFPGGAVTPSFVDPNAVGGSILDGPGPGLIAAGVPGTAGLCFLPGAGSTTAASALANADYLEFTLAPGPGLGLSLGSFSFEATRASVAGTAGFVLRSSRDNFAADLASFAIPAVSPARTSFNIGLSSAAYQNLIAPIAFRLYGYSAGGALCFNDISVNGAVVAPPPAVPEPGTVLYGVALLGAAAWPRRSGRR